MKWLDKITGIFTAGNDGLSDSIIKANEVAKVVLSSEQKAQIRSKVKESLARVQSILVDLVDEIPGVPRSVATLGVTLLVNALEAAIASAIQAAKAKK